MSKPLIFVFQLIGAVMIIVGVPDAMTGTSYGTLVIGAILLLLGSFGWRKRMKS